MEPTEHPGSEKLLLDPSGNRMSCGNRIYQDMPECVELPALPVSPTRLSLDPEVYAVSLEGALQKGFGLTTNGGRNLLRLGMDSPTIDEAGGGFRPDGKLLAWGMTDGSVFLCSLEEIERRLQSLGLGHAIIR